MPDKLARQKMVAQFSIEDTQPEWALAYRFGIVLHGREATVFEPAGEH